MTGMPASAPAHSPGGAWRYPAACCSGDLNGGECGPIPNEAVSPEKNGFAVVLRPGDHRKVTHRNRYLVPYGDVLPSGDNRYHICLHPTEEIETCFFAPPDAI